jgi:hypothetical protein
MSDERRTRDTGPPTLIMQAYQEMDADDRNRIQLLGFGMVVGGVTAPLVASVLGTVTAPAWAFCTLVIGLGFCAMWPPFGMWLFDAIPRALVKVMPSKVAGLLRPDRRNDGGER